MTSPRLVDGCLSFVVNLFGKSFSSTMTQLHRSLHFDSLNNCFVFQTINWNYLRTGSLDWSSASQTNGHPHSQTHLRIHYRTFAKVGDWFPILSYNFNSVVIDRIFNSQRLKRNFLVTTLNNHNRRHNSVWGGIWGMTGRNSRRGSRSHGMLTLDEYFMICGVCFVAFRRLVSN